jgi:hypothetical protein
VAQHPARVPVRDDLSLPVVFGVYCDTPGSVLVSTRISYYFALRKQAGREQCARDRRLGSASAISVRDRLGAELGD